MTKILKLKDLSKRFGAIVASNNIDFNLKRNEIHALIGPNGAGKSSLVKQIIGEIRQDSGEIWLNGEEISHLSTSERVCRGLARTFQVTNVVGEFSVLENVMLAVIGYMRSSFNFFISKKKYEELYQQAFLSLVDTKLEHKKDLLANQLSHGERRQLELCLVLALRPKIILLDEPMAGLGLDAIDKMQKIFSEVKVKAPILLIEHDMNVVFSLADRISVLVYGKIIATGDPLTIKNNEQVQQAYFGI